MKRLLPFLLVLASVGIGVLHFVTPGHDMFLHDTWRRLGYFPIAVGAIFYGLRGGIWMGLLSSIAFIPHLLHYFGNNPVTYRSELTEVFLYFAAGALIGSLAGREKRLTTKYQNVSKELEASLGRLKQEAITLLTLEEQLRVIQKRGAAYELSTSLAHEIKNPLASIRGAAEIIQDETPEESNSKRFAGILIKETERLDRTLASMLSMVSVVESDEAEVKPLHDVVDHLSDTMGIRLKNRDVRLAMVCNEKVGQLAVNSEKVSQVLVNLVLNAVEATGEGGTIRVTAESLEGMVCITVLDSGPGIDPQQIERLFEPFVSGRKDGSGLGLPISRRIAESLGGTLTAENHKESGAAFVFTFPCKVGEMVNARREPLHGV